MKVLDNALLHEPTYTISLYTWCRDGSDFDVVIFNW
jgi:hypothetical protein